MGGVHNERTMLSQDPNQLLQYTFHLCQRENHLRPRSLLSLTSELHLLEDLWHLRSARKLLTMDDAPHDAFACYLPAELDRARSYAEKYLNMDETKRCQPQDLIVHVGDNPAGTSQSKGWCTWSAASGKIPTIRRSSGLYLALFHNRHLVMKELYLSMGYPCFPAVAQAAGVAQYEVFLPQFTYFDCLRALGNSMHVASVGIVVGALMLCTQLQG